ETHGTGLHARLATASHKRAAKGASVVFSGEGTSRTLRSFRRNDHTAVLVGRDTAGNLKVLDVSGRRDVARSTLSEKFAQITWTNNMLRVVDLGSRDGTYLTGRAERLEPQRAYELADGSIIYFGRFSDKVPVATVHLSYEEDLAEAGSAQTRLQSRSTSDEEDDSKVINIECTNAEYTHRMAQGVSNGEGGRTQVHNGAVQKASAGTKHKRAHEDEETQHMARGQ
ncbi:hypothetical protein FRC07_009592, partial [Ceratobasidium sp. 392]